jgi:hypothetical protein
MTARLPLSIATPFIATLTVGVPTYIYNKSGEKKLLPKLLPYASFPIDFFLTISSVAAGASIRSKCHFPVLFCIGSYLLATTIENVASQILNISTSQKKK